jgi:hypothetical protein
MLGVLSDIKNEFMDKETVELKTAPPTSKGGKRSVKAPDQNVRLTVNVVAEIYMDSG